MKLYEVPGNSKIRLTVDGDVPPAAPELKKDDILTFSHIDGMYSLCFDSEGNPVHLIANAEVEIVSES